MPSEINAGYELSPQQKLVFRQSPEKQTAGLAILLEGHIETGELRQAIEALITRHEILRTRFQRRTGMRFPFQVVRERAEISWEEIDLSAIDRAGQKSSIEEMLGQGSKIDSEIGSLVACRLVKLDPNRSVLLLVFSLAAADSRSLNLVFREIASLYDGQPVSEEVVQYADYSEWQNELLREEGEQAKKAAEFWRQKSVPALSLPLQRKRPVSCWSWQSVPVSLPPSINQSASPEDFLFACWQILLWRLSGQNEFVSGYASDGRNHEEFTGGLGPFSKALPVDFKLDRETTFQDFLVSCGKLRAEALEWQDYFSPDRIAEPAAVNFLFARLPEATARRGVRFSEFGRHLPAPGCSLELRSSVSSSSSSAALDFDASQFDRELVELFAESFSLLASAAWADPSSELGALPITPASERQRVVEEFNRTGASYPNAKCIHQLFEEQAALHGERPALRFGEKQLSFLELNREANRIAHMLRRHQVGPDVPVALSVERSAGMIVALLGILKAGGCYVPLIPDNPKPRLAHQLAETGAPVVITDEKHLDQLPEFAGKVICLDRDRALLGEEPDSNPEVNITPEKLAYVIYTSGSTGIPKGVAVPHSCLVNYSYALCRRLELDKYPEGLEFATVSTLAADLGNTCIFPALVSGGCLHVISYEMAMSPFVFADYASRHAIDVLKITPSHLSTLLNSDAGPSLVPRKYLILGGEAARWDLVERVRKLGNCTIFNHYGPTEATVGCCMFKLDGAADGGRETATVPIGRPIANDQIYILDARLQPVPVGVAGELWVGGAGVARGYLNQPRQTAASFVPNPFSRDPNARLYRTGDLARFLPDGNVEFLGRIDQQVKIRGFRVEPAEIAAVCRRHPSVEQAAIVPYEGKSGEKRLAAYLVGSGRREDLRAFLSRELPDYMVPASIVWIDALPLTSNGKLDVPALPSPEQQAAREAVLPRTPDEEKLARIWQEVLRLESVGVTDNFFELGGHSLLATQIISRIRNAFRLQISLEVFLRHPTIAELAAEIRQLEPAGGDQEEMAKLLEQLEGLSDEEAERLLAAELEKEGN
jgi:amino acid adenylation domain-containing protein